MRKLRLGIFLKDISPHSGGGYTFAETIISGLAESGISDQIIIFHYGSSQELRKKFKDSTQVEFVALAGSKFERWVKKLFFEQVLARLQGFFAKISRVFRIKLPFPYGSILDSSVRAQKIDLVWFPTPDFEWTDLPYVMTVWDLEHRVQPYFPEVSRFGEWAAREKYFEKALQRASYVVTGTEVGKQEVCRFYGVDPDRIRLLPHPTPSFVKNGGDKTSATLPFDTQDPFVLYPAQFWAHKNHVGLLNALAVLRSQGLRVNCAFVGSDKGNRAWLVEKVKELGLESQVHFLGFVERDLLLELYRRAHALVYSSLCGPENLPPLEAMALGCPVIASAIPGAKEQLGSGALLTNTLKPQELADAIRSLFAPDLRKKLLAEGTQRAAAYTEAEFLRDMGGILDEFRPIRDLWSPHV